MDTERKRLSSGDFADRGPVCKDKDMVRCGAGHFAERRKSCSNKKHIRCLLQQNACIGRVQRQSSTGLANPDQRIREHTGCLAVLKLGLTIYVDDDIRDRMESRQNDDGDGNTNPGAINCPTCYRRDFSAKGRLSKNLPDVS